jgi:hypothetical protein
VVIQRTRSLAAIEATKGKAAARPAEETTPPQVDVPLPDLTSFNQLLGHPAADNPVSVFFA